MKWMESHIRNLSTFLEVGAVWWKKKHFIVSDYASKSEIK